MFKPLLTVLVLSLLVFAGCGEKEEGGGPATLRINGQQVSVSTVLATYVPAQDYLAISCLWTSGSTGNNFSFALLPGYLRTGVTYPIDSLTLVTYGSGTTLYVVDSMNIRFTSLNPVNATFSAKGTGTGSASGQTFTITDARINNVPWTIQN